jgi:hypothetical protein
MRSVSRKAIAAGGNFGSSVCRMASEQSAVKPSLGYDAPGLVTTEATMEDELLGASGADQHARL